MGNRVEYSRRKENDAGKGRRNKGGWRRRAGWHGRLVSGKKWDGRRER